MTSSHELARSSGTFGEEVFTTGIPAVPATTITRPALGARLDQVTRTGEGAVLVVCAPAGSGKTLLIADWITRRAAANEAGAVAWLSLLSAVREPATLWDALRRSVGQDPQPGPAEFTTPAADAAAFAGIIAAQRQPLLLVIDDAHLITDPLALAGLEWLLQRLPAGVTVIVAARYEPPVQWHAIARSGRVTRLGAADLALSSDEVALVCGQHGCELAPAELHAIVEVTGGWAALVRILAICLATQSDGHESVLAALPRPPQVVTDFLVGELIAKMPAPARTFLTYTAIPDSFTEELADSLVPGKSGAVLAGLGRMNFPVTTHAQDGVVWFSYQPMLRAYFQAEARRLGPARYSEIHRRTAEWYCTAGYYLRALPHVIAAAAPGALAAFLASHAAQIVLAGGGSELFGELRRSAPAILNDPFIWPLRAMEALLRGDTAEACSCLDVARAQSAGADSFAPSAWIRALFLAAATDAAITMGVEITSASPFRDLAGLALTGDPDLDCYISIQRATALLADGHLAAAQRLLQAGLARAEQAGHPRLAVKAVVRLAMAAGAAGSITAMRSRAAWAVEVAVQHGISGTPDSALAGVLASYGAYLQGDKPAPDLVRAALASRTHFDGTVGPAAGWPAQVLGDLLQFGCGPNPGDVVTTLQHNMISLLDDYPLAVTTVGLVPPVVWVLTQTRELPAAQQLVERSAHILGDSPEITLSRAMLADAANKPKSVLAVLASLPEAERTGPVTAVFRWLLLAKAQHQLGLPQKAHECLAHAVRVAAPEHLVRPFLDVPEALDLLDAGAARFRHYNEFADQVRRHPEARRDGSRPALTDTELKVLAQLPAGHTARQIADELGISVNTVKTHMRGIYAKMGTNSRAAALEQARQCGLL